MVSETKLTYGHCGDDGVELADTENVCFIGYIKNELSLKRGRKVRLSATIS